MVPDNNNVGAKLVFTQVIIFRQGVTPALYRHVVYRYTFYLKFFA